MPASVFSIGWALALIAVAVWGVRVNRRWVVNVAAVFGAIHFYTQWFERLGATPLSVLLAGLLALGLALGLRALQQVRRLDGTLLVLRGRHLDFLKRPTPPLDRSPIIPHQGTGRRLDVVPIGTISSLVPCGT